MRRPSLPALPRRPLLLAGVLAVALVAAVAGVGVAVLRDGGGSGPA